jgi:hypothetical protein
MALKEIAEELEVGINFMVDGIQSAASTEALGRTCNSISAYYRALGICELLIDADVDGFQHQLVRSGQVRKHLLATRQTEKNTVDPAIRSSVVGPFLAALAAHHLDLAREIGILSPKTWFQKDEYEDDFIYARFLYDLAVGRSAPGDLAVQLDRFEEVLEGGPSQRLPICRALLARDQAAFDEAFAALLVARRAEVKKEAKTFQAEELTFHPESRVFVEGLALLELATRQGLTTLPEYPPLCPSLARRQATKPFDQGYFPGQPI